MNEIGFPGTVLRHLLMIWLGHTFTASCTAFRTIHHLHCYHIHPSSLTSSAQLNYPTIYHHLLDNIGRSKILRRSLHRDPLFHCPSRLTASISVSLVSSRRDCTTYEYLLSFPFSVLFAARLFFSLSYSRSVVCAPTADQSPLAHRVVAMHRNHVPSIFRHHLEYDICRPLSRCAL